MTSNSLTYDEILNEHEHQSLLVSWVLSSTGKYPELHWFHAIPNGAKLPYTKTSSGKRFSKEAARLKAEGLRSGIPDTCLPVPCGGFHDLYIEIKT